MAHILVYLQRTPRGLHPASAIALCLARDVASERGATITGFCAGDAGAVDRGIARAAGRFGADLLMFTGAGVLGELCEQLRPVHIMTPWTAEGLSAVEGGPTGPVAPRWVDGQRPGLFEVDAVTGIVAGTYPWHELAATLEADYGGGVDEVVLPDWTRATSFAAGGEPVFEDGEAGPLVYVAPADLDPTVHRELAALGARSVSMPYAREHHQGTLLWFDAGPNGPARELEHRAPGARVILLPGPMAGFHETWALADWVLPGPWPQVVRQFQDSPWRAVLT